MKRLRRKQNKKGSVALEAVLSGGALIMVFILILGYFTYLYPRYMVDLEVQNLSHSVKMDGKLTENDFNTFITNMENRGYREEDVREGTQVIAVLSDPVNKEGAASHGDSLIDTTEHKAGIVERNNGQIIVRVRVPANDHFLGVGLGWFGADMADSLRNYTVERVVMSEAYLPSTGVQ